MARLIDADKLVAHFRATKIDEVFPNWKDLFPSTQAAIIRLTTNYRAIVLSAPTVDAVEVVRCKDCKHYDKSPLNNSDRCMCTKFLGLTIPKPDDFCSYGERKDK